MSVQFGRCNFVGHLVETSYLEAVKSMLAPYAAEEARQYTKQSTTLLYRALHTTRESRIEQQPFVTPSGAVLTWDGRLDNRTDLLGSLRGSLTLASPDISFVAAAYERWGIGCASGVVIESSGGGLEVPV